MIMDLAENYLAELSQNVTGRFDPRFNDLSGIHCSRPRAHNLAHDRAPLNRVTSKIDGCL
jgi:hypothetical protein